MTQRKPPEEADDYQLSVLTGMLELAEREAGRALTPQERRAIKEEYLAAGGLQPAVPRRARKPRRITSSPVAHADVALICELDEQWAFVGSKAVQHWL